MRDITQEEFDAMTRDELVTAFTAVMDEIGQALERATTVIANQNAHIDHLHQKVRELEADA